ncbi:UTP--glucose-1-phosphate uridylyltransferase [archaeon HR01]|nr:UTP--glucose-1-phosphate uridylyltransferase [archaeon HR01]
MKAVILSGGYGKRLRPLTNTVPKPLLEVGGRPIIEWQIEWLKSYGIKEFVICAGYLKEKILEAVGGGNRLGVKLGYAVEDEPLGTGGALKNAKHLLSLEKMFLVVNGDILTNLNPLKMVERINGKMAVMAVTPLQSPYGVVDFDRQSLVVKRFREKPKLADYYVNAGVYLFTSEIFDYLPSVGDMEKQTFPHLAEKELILAEPYEDIQWISIDSHKDLEEAVKLVDVFRYAEVGGA